LTTRKWRDFLFKAAFFAWDIRVTLMRISPFAVLIVLFGLGGCAIMEGIEKKQAEAREERERAELRKLASAEHAVFRAAGGWKKRTYRNQALLSQATSDNVSLEISLTEQRGILLVRTAIAMDFPVATGRKSHPTPAGDYTIRAKEKNYASNLYGRIYDAQDLLVVSDADVRSDMVPEGGRFEGATMPYWMRLTDSGVGLHVGYVPGRPASHGCIRLKRDSATQIFELVKVGTPVVIAENAPSLASPESG
jgi:L,D-transpeptidase catalytic domain